MSNIQRISQMSMEEILALDRQIFLKNEMSVNYQDFTDLHEFADQFAWSSTNPDVGVINMTRYGITEDIR